MFSIITFLFRVILNLFKSKKELIIQTENEVRLFSFHQ